MVKVPDPLLLLLLLLMSLVLSVMDLPPLPPLSLLHLSQARPAKSMVQATSTLLQRANRELLVMVLTRHQSPLIPRIPPRKRLVLHL